MNSRRLIRSICWGAAGILLAATGGCGSGEEPRGEAPPAVRATPDPAGETLLRWREKGIEPRRARFSRKLEE